MRLRRWILLLAAGAVGYCLGTQPWGTARYAGWTRAARGLETRSFTTSDGTVNVAGGVKINAVRAVASRVRILGGAYRDAGAWRAADKAVAAVNGGFFDPLHRPVGLLVSGGKIVSRLSRSHGGVFYTLDSTAHILSADQFADEDPDDVKEAVQCGPLLVENHQPNHLKQQYARRTGIGVQRNGRVVIAVADGAISLPAWAALWASSSGLDCVTALNLDGGPSTQLSMQSGQVALDIRGGWPVPDAVSVR